MDIVLDVGGSQFLTAPAPPSADNLLFENGTDILQFENGTDLLEIE